MIGLDIGSKTIKIIEIEKVGQTFKLKASGIVAHTAEAIENLNDEKDLAVISGIIKRLHKEAKVSSKEVSIALPEPLVFTRSIKFPMLTDQEIDSAVKWEAEQYIPIPINEAIVQHIIVERNEGATPPEVTVLLVAAPKKLVDKYMKLAEGAGLTVTAVETELMALTRSLGINGKTVLLADFGAKSTDIAISKNAQLVFSRSIPTAGEAFTRALSQTLGIEYRQAEEYKKTYGLSSQLEGKISGALNPVFRIVTDEIKKAIHYYQSEEKGEVPSALILSGGTSGMPEAASFLTKFLGIEVVIGNPFSKVSVDPEALKTLSLYAPLYSIAIGLALREE